MKKVLAASLMMVLVGCGQAPSPDSIYQQYNAKVVSGISFEEEKTFYTVSKVAAVDAMIPNYMKQMKKSEQEVIEFYLHFSQSMAKCKKITLDEEKITADKAELVYSLTDSCGNDPKPGEKKTVKMINEDGWKIDSVTIGLKL